MAHAGGVIRVDSGRSSNDMIGDHESVHDSSEIS